MPTATPAPLHLRLFALAYDLFPLAALWMATAGLVLLAAHGDVDVAHPPAGYRLFLQFALLAVSAVYFVLSWTRGGQTIGMRAWRIRIVAAEGGALPWPRALLRFGVALPSLTAFGLGFLWCLVDRDRRAWHDLAARSACVRVANANV
ncbi:MAG: RDD family protein [Lysobacteraceae bacterium]|nr:MAG: RDD family protein [Xanthomonadaceae bacterium]